jgi:ABC-type multidrug transport system fused ATPase/permease subunit
MLCSSLHRPSFYGRNSTFSLFPSFPNDIALCFFFSLLQINNDEPEVKKYHSYENDGYLSRIWKTTKQVTKRILGLQEDETAYEALRAKDGDVDDLSDHGTGEETASWVSLLFFMWFNSVVALGRKKPLYLRDMGKLLPSLEPSLCADALSSNWEKETSDPASHLPSFKRALFYTYRWKVLLVGLPRIWRISSGFLSPLLLKWIIEVVENPGAHSKWYGFGLVLALFLEFQIGSIAFQHYCHLILKAEVCVKSGVTSLLYKKLLKLSASSKQSNIHGKMMNLIGSDVERLQEMIWYGHFFWLTPTLIVVCFGTVTHMLGIYPAIAGFGLLIIIVPASALVSKKLEKLREIQTELTDARVRATNEIFHTMKTVKVYALEDHFAKGADEARRVELEAIRKMQLWKAFNQSVNDATIPIMCLATLVTFILRGGTLTPSNAFALVGVYAALHWPFLMITSSLSATIECLVSIRRIQEFLELPEVPGLHLSSSLDEHGVELPAGSISLQGASFSWDFEDSLTNLNFTASPGSLTCIVGPVGSGKSSLLNTLLGEIKQTAGTTRISGKIAYAPQIPFLLHATVRENITFGCEFFQERYAKTIECCALQADLDMLVAGDLTVIGERGINLSGGQKARIAMARAVYSDCDICLLDDPLSAVDAHVGHKLFNDCIKVLLKSKTVLLVTHQLQFVTHGDQLVVMQNGTIQHFGSPQQLRQDGVDLVALLEKFNEELNKHAAIEPIEEHSMSMDDEDDEIRGSYDSMRLSASGSIRRSGQLKTSSGSSSVAAVTDDDDDGQIANEDEYHADLTAEQQAAVFSKANVTQKEERGTGSIGAAVYKFYFSHKKYWWMLAVLFIIIHRAIDMFVQVYMGKWSASNTPAGGGNKGNSSPSSSPQEPFSMPLAIPMDFAPPKISEPELPINLFSLAGIVASVTSSAIEATSQASVAIAKIPPSTVQFLIIFSVSDLLLVIFQMLKASIILIVCCWTGKVVYMEMFNKLLRAPMAFFDTTPKGRIAARCSSDTDAMDNRIGDPLSSTVTALATIVGSIVIISMSVGWWVLGLIPMALVYYSIWNRAIGTFRDVTRLEGNSKAPLNTIFSESLNGLYTLRAFARQPQFVQQLYHKLDCLTRVYYHKYSCERWLSLRIEGVGVTLAALFGLVGVFNTSLNPGLVAAALTSLIMNSEIVGELIHGYTHIESYMNSVERIQQYTAIETERPAHIETYNPPANWPDHGYIKFDNVSYRYRPGLPLVLNEMSFLIKPGEKIGVVGRTGAGKSSILSALLSLSPIANGKIIIDDCDINKMGVGDLRSRLSIIPQDPVIFEGSVRHNIDPFGKYGDDEIWSILRRIHLADAIEALPKKLDSELAEDGANFSLGQRQLMCVGRALLKRSKILLLDEASSSIDLETDYLLQKTLRTEFADCTTITIAHRLATIMDSDRVMVLDAGSVKEFDTPSVLLSNPNSLFFHLHQQTQSSSNAASSSVVAGNSSLVSSTSVNLI